MSTKAPNSLKEPSGSFTMSKTNGFNSILPKPSKLHTDVIQSNQVQYRNQMGGNKKLNEPTLVHTSKFPPSNLPHKLLAKSNHLPPSN